MSLLDMKEIRALGKSEIEKKVAELRKSQFLLKMEAGTTGASKPHLNTVYKKSIARCLTALRDLNK